MHGPQRAALLRRARGAAAVVGGVCAVGALAGTCARGWGAVLAGALGAVALGSGLLTVLMPAAAAPAAATATGGGCARCGAAARARQVHCGRCGVCVAGRTHHCGALGGCVGGHNRGFFVVFAGSSAAGAWVAVGACAARAPAELRALLAGMPGARARLVWVCAFHAAAVAATGLSAVAAFHAYLVASGRTPAEFAAAAALAPPGPLPPARFSRGSALANCAAVMGAPCARWQAPSQPPQEPQMGAEVAV